MLRCPFNNFSKCDGSCPFSMPDFAGCRLATSLIAIEGIVRGTNEHIAKMHMEQVTTNAHLADIRKVEQPTQDTKANGGKDKGPAPRDPRSYLIYEMRNKGLRRYRLSLNEADYDDALEVLGDKVDVNVIVRPTPRIILSPGGSAVISVNGSGNSSRGRVSVDSLMDKLVDAFGVHRRVYLKSSFEGGLMTLVGDGDFYDVEEEGI